MENICTFLVYIVLFTLIQGYVAVEIIQEYCAGENFRASCSNDEIIVMQNAEFGRIRLGRCITKDMGYLSCSSNVLKHFDTLCSNKKTCETAVSDVDIPLTTTCWAELKNHLEASYRCQKFFQVDCNSDRTMIHDNTIISSASLTKCGSASRVFSALPSQRLNISMIDFTWDNEGGTGCRSNYGTLTDAISSNSANVCGGGKREKNLVVSNGHLINFEHSSLSNSNFLLKFQVIGCGDVKAPDGVWVRREGGQLVMGCISGKHTWTLKCEDNKWTGATGQCGTVSSAVASRKEEKMSYWDISLGIMAFGFASCLVFLASVVFVIGVCIHVKRSDDSTATAMQGQPLIMHQVPNTMKRIDC